MQNSNRNMSKQIIKIGIVTYESLHCNFTNYGTALQAWALGKALSNFNIGYDITVKLIDYCPVTMTDKDPLNPMDNMWDNDDIARKMCEELLPDIHENYNKFVEFYHRQCNLSSKTYNSNNFDDIVEENFDLFVCGSDSIWDFTEFGIDDVYWANKSSMKNRAIAYAPSFQDSYFKYSFEDKEKILSLMRNFSYIGLRDLAPIPDIQEKTDCLIQRVLDPTLLLTKDDYDEITSDRLIENDYLLYYSRRYNPIMEACVDNVADKLGLKVVEISIRTLNRGRHILYYSAGVEDFLSLVKHSKFVITNSFHCLIFAMHFKKDFYVFGREHCNNKIQELLTLLGVHNRFLNDNVMDFTSIDYESVYEKLQTERMKSVDFLVNATKNTLSKTE